MLNPSRVPNKQNVKIYHSYIEQIMLNVIEITANVISSPNMRIDYNIMEVTWCLCRHTYDNVGFVSIQIQDLAGKHLFMEDESSSVSALVE